MEHYDPDLKYVEVRQRMDEIRQWATNERQARQAQAHQPSFVNRIGLIVQRTILSLRQVSRRRRIAHDDSNTRASAPKLAPDNLISGGSHEGC